MKKITIAIDGFSSCGKSTLAKALASRLHYRYIDSGAMYRCVTLYMLRNGWEKDFEETGLQKIIASLNNIKIDFHFNPESQSSEALLNGENVEKEIRSMEVNRWVSKVSAIPEVRRKMAELQKAMGRGGGVVMDGRDIGTHIFPDAELKIFMTADELIRAQRRFDELKSKGVQVSMDEVLKNLKERDKQDTERKDHPLRKADDAIILDNSDLTKEQQLEFVLSYVKDILGHL
ncbi:MAG: (d)CMP kinase [Bacteroidia bacterium]|nr:(d)CMP kinase [Bacteroidia bacterium]